jgi:hypothetical protein
MECKGKRFCRKTSKYLNVSMKFFQNKGEYEKILYLCQKIIKLGDLAIYLWQKR